jgi:hypothetical protein
MRQASRHGIVVFDRGTRRVAVVMVMVVSVIMAEERVDRDSRGGG